MIVISLCAAKASENLGPGSPSLGPEPEQYGEGDNMLLYYTQKQGHIHTG